MAGIRKWWVYGPCGEGGSQRFHLETRHRLDRVDAALQPNAYFRGSAEQLREQLRVHQQQLLPELPVGYRWVGPQLVDDVCSAVLGVPRGAGKSEAASVSHSNRYDVHEAA